MIEGGERRMIHQVFELGDTLAREVMVPRTDVVWIERHKTLRQAMSLLLRSGYSRIPVIEDDLDTVVGFAYLKDISRRVFDRHDAESCGAGRVGDAPGAARARTPSRPTTCSPRCRPSGCTWRSSSTSTAARPGWSPSRTSWRRSSVRSPTSTTRRPPEVERLDDGAVRVSARYPIDDLPELGFVIEDDEIDSVGGLMAKHLGKVPIAGSAVEVEGICSRPSRRPGGRTGSAPC